MPTQRPTGPLILQTLLLALLSTLATPAAAQATPGAGTLLQQAQPVAPPVPSTSETGLTIERDEGSQLPPSAPFLLQRIELTGNHAIATETLLALVADAQGKSLTLPELGQLARRITMYYRAQGYPLARAIIPAQTIRDGVVVMRVLEAHYGRILLDNRSQVNDALLQDTLAALQTGQDIRQAEMDRSLLLLSDMPAVAVAATLKPGETIGAADLLVEVGAEPATSGYVGLDNYGSRYTGRERLSGVVNVHNPLHHGDTFSAGGMSSGAGMNYARLGYDLVLNGRGSRLGGSYSALNYALGDTLDALQAHGTAEMASLWARHPLLRSRPANLYAQIQLDQLQLHDRVDTTATRTDRHLDVWTASLSGDLRDTWLVGAVNTWSVSWTGGQLGFDNSAAQQADEASARTRGNYARLNASLSHWQGLSSRSTLFLAYSGQWAQNNLDSSQKVAVGGPASVRAYDVSAVSADNVQLLTVEFRHDVGRLAGGPTQVIAFADAASVEVNKNTWTVGANTDTLSGAGLGLNWRGPAQWNFKVYLATPLDRKSTLVANPSSTRGWAELNKRF